MSTTLPRSNGAIEAEPGKPAAELCQVTVQGGGRRVDLGVPVDVPILELTPALAALFHTSGARDGGRSGRDHGTPPAWSLARAGEQPLELTGTLAEAGVVDGEVLHLVDVATWRAPRVSDLEDAVSNALERDGWDWPGEAGRWFLAGLSAASLLVAGVLASASDGVVTGARGLLALLLAAVLGLLAAFSGREAARRPARLALAISAVAFTALAGWGLAGGAGGWAGLSAAAAGATVALAGLWMVIPAVSPGGVLVGGVLAVAAAAVSRGAPPAAVATVVGVLGVMALRLWPAVVSRALAALLAPATQAAAEQAVSGSRRVLASISAGTALLVLGAALVLLADGGAFAVGLAAVAVVALGLRAQTYRFVPEALPAALAAGGGLLATEVMAGWRLLAAHGWAGLGAVLPAGIGLGLAVLMLLPFRPPRSGRRVQMGWLAVDLALVPLALGASGMLGLVIRLVEHLLH